MYLLRGRSLATSRPPIWTFADLLPWYMSSTAGHGLTHANISARCPSILMCEGTCSCRPISPVLTWNLYTCYHISSVILFTSAYLDKVFLICSETSGGRAVTRRRLIPTPAISTDTFETPLSSWWNSRSPLLVVTHPSFVRCSRILYKLSSMEHQLESHEYRPHWDAVCHRANHEFDIHGFSDFSNRKTKI